MSVCKRHEKQIRELSAYNVESVLRRTLGATLLDTLPPDLKLPTTELALKPATVSTEEGTEATFVSDISSDPSLGSEVIKANTILCGATKLVAPLTTSTSFSAFAVDAIIRIKPDKLYDIQANKLSSQVKVFHGGLS